MHSTTFIFAVGVETYQDRTIETVEYAEDDVTEFVQAWRELGVADENIEILLSSVATKTTIESRLKTFLAGITKRDRVVFYYAGHGLAKDHGAYVTAFDAQRADLEGSSVPLGFVLEQLRSSASNQALLFIDACNSGLPVVEGMRSIYTGFTDDELRSFCKDSEYHFAFASCQIDQSSYSSKLFKHGVWSHSIIEALKGNAKEAFERTGIITGQSLQGYIAQQVPINLRKAFTHNVGQTPCVFGNFTKEFIVADLGDLLSQRKLAAQNVREILKEASLLKEERGRVSELSGFSKHNKEPDYHSQATASFVETAGEEEVKDLADEIHDGVRSNFDYRRRELGFSREGAGATIRTPDFDVNIELIQSVADPSEYLLSTKVAIIEPDILLDERFLGLFSNYCHSVLFEMTSKIDVDEKITQIDDNDELRDFLKYDPEGQFLELTIPDTGILLRISPYRFTFSIPYGSDLRALLEGTKGAIAMLGGPEVGVKLIETKA